MWGCASESGEAALATLDPAGVLAMQARRQTQSIQLNTPTASLLSRDVLDQISSARRYRVPATLSFRIKTGELEALVCLQVRYCGRGCSQSGADKAISTTASLRERHGSGPRTAETSV